MTELRASLPPLPDRMRGLPVDRRGYPVPYFVAWFDGEPDHRVVDPEKFRRCVRLGVCWICGEPLGRFKSFAIGPMCGINRVSSEPPQHRECAQFSATACPFMTRPRAVRRAANLPEERHEAGGIMIERNPGVVLVWTTTWFRPYRTPQTTLTQAGVIFDFGDPTSVEFYSQGRAATRAEVDESVRGGVPALLEAAQIRTDPDEIAHFAGARARFEALLDRVLPT